MVLLVLVISLVLVVGEALLLKRTHFLFLLGILSLWCQVAVVLEDLQELPLDLLVLTPMWKTMIPIKMLFGRVEEAAVLTVALEVVVAMSLLVLVDLEEVVEILEIITVVGAAEVQVVTLGMVEMRVVEIAVLELLEVVELLVVVEDKVAVGLKTMVVGE